VQIGDRVIVLGARPANVRRILSLPTSKPRQPAAPGVAEAEQAIMDELGLS
jgi:ABC-type nitrate/sulfonate/bicarbonate transport system ATPase subunit